jgi:type IV pilus assembly protein PilP
MAGSVRRTSVRISAVAIAIGLLALPGCQGDKRANPAGGDAASASEQKSAKGKKKRGRAAQGAAGDVAKASAAMQKEFTYTSAGRRDPFRSFEWEQLKLDALTAGEGTPLERFDVGQLSLVAVVWDVKSARALLQDPSGMSYIIGTGARIGKNDGRVIRIDDNLVVVKETYVDYLGEETTKDIEMSIRTTEGG